jgi:hypothetical protein
METSREVQAADDEGGIEPVRVDPGVGPGVCPVDGLEDRSGGMDVGELAAAGDGDGLAGPQPVATVRAARRATPNTGAFDGRMGGRAFIAALDAAVGTSVMGARNHAPRLRRGETLRQRRGGP